MSAGIASNLRWYAANGGFDPEQERHLLEIADAIDLAHARKIARGGFDERRYRKVCRALEGALQDMTEWGC